MPEAFSLRTYVNDRLAHTFPDVPKRIAEQIVDEVPEEFLRQALAEALPNYVRVTMANKQRPTARQWDEFAEGNGDPPEMMVRGAEEWKPIADCAAEDLRAAADRRRGQAESLQAWARRFERIAEGTPLTAGQFTQGHSRSDIDPRNIWALTKRRDQLRRDITERSSPHLRRLQAQRKALLALRAMREAQMQHFARLEDVLRGREANN